MSLVTDIGGDYNPSHVVKKYKDMYYKKGLYVEVSGNQGEYVGEINYTDASGNLVNIKSVKRSSKKKAECDVCVFVLLQNNINLEKYKKIRNIQNL